MPNWTFNKLRIDGDKESIAKFRKQAKIKGKTYLSFNNFVSLPKELKDTQSPPNIVSEKDYPKRVAEAKKNKLELGLPITKKQQKKFIKKFGFDNWYNWQVANWGTKWDACNVEFLKKNDSEILRYSFDTAWSPPIMWLAKTAKMFPKLLFSLTYEGEGEKFMGKAKAENGNLIYDKRLK